MIKIILQSNLAKWYPKKRCAIVSTFVRKQHCLLPFQLRLAKLSFVRITPRWSSQINILTFKGIFNFHTSGGLCTLHGVWERPPANNLPQTPHSAGAYGTGYVLFFIRACLWVEFEHLIELSTENELKIGHFC